MRQQDVFKKIGGILQELNEQYDYLKTQEGPIDDLELELFAANSNFLSDHLEIFRKLNTHAVKSLPEHHNEPDINVIAEKEQDAKSEPLFQPYQQTAEESATTELLPLSDEISSNRASDEQLPEDDYANKDNSGFEFDFSPSSIYNEADVATQPQFETGGTEEGSQDLEDSQELHKADEITNDEHSPNIYEQIAVNAAKPETDGPAHQMDLTTDTGHDHFGYVRSVEPETIRHELTLDDANTWEDKQAEPEHEENVAEALAAVEITPEPAAGHPVAQALAAEPEKPLTLNERIAAQAGVHQNAQAATQQPVKDLKSAITLNDKMLFVRDLFNGYSLAYSEAIEILNRFNNYDDADRFLTTNYVAKNNWEDKPGTKEKFYDLLKRRYA